jgi:hypothetical protein
VVVGRAHTVDAQMDLLHAVRVLAAHIRHMTHISYANNTIHRDNRRTLPPPHLATGLRTDWCQDGGGPFQAAHRRLNVRSGPQSAMHRVIKDVIYDSPHLFTAASLPAAAALVPLPVV